MSDAAGAGRPDPLWEDWDTPPRVPTAPVLHLNGFDGPMDVLLDLAERQRIDLGRISVTDLATQFVAAMEQLADKVPLDRRADWLVLATRLVLLRAKLLFPKSLEVAAEAEQKEVAEIRHLNTRLTMRAAADWLQAQPQLGFDVFARPILAPAAIASGYVTLMEACLTVLRGQAAQPDAPPDRPPRRPALWTMADARMRIEAMLAEHPEGAPLTLFFPQVQKEDPHWRLTLRIAAVRIFSTGLELVKQQDLNLEQDKLFSEIQVSRVEST